MRSEELFKIHEKICKESLELMKKKNHDYSGKSGFEPFANFTRAEAMGITTTEKGMLVRMLDKMSRLSSFMEAKEFKVQDEKIEDTIKDMINYSILLYAYLQDKNYSTPIYELDYADVEFYSKGKIVPDSEDPKVV